MQIYPSIRVKIRETWVAKCLKNPKVESSWSLWVLAHNSVLQHHPFQSNCHFESTCFVSHMQKFWSFNFSPPWGDCLALLSFGLSNQLSKFHNVPTFLSFIRIWAFQGLWDLSEIQALCLFTLLMFVSWFLGTMYFSRSSSWFHDFHVSSPTLVMLISWFLGTTLFSCFSSC